MPASHADDNSCPIAQPIPAAACHADDDSVTTAERDALAVDVGPPQVVAYRRSLRASRERRASSARRRRRIFRSRGATLLAAVGLVALSGGAVAQVAAPGPSGGEGTPPSLIVAAQRALGVTADGIIGPQTRAATIRFQREKGLAADGVIGPQTLAALGISPGAVASSHGDVLARIAACESSGNPAAISADGVYRGKYQFSRASWRMVGGSGDPAAAPETEQDARAARLLAQLGPSAWPNCA